MQKFDEVPFVRSFVRAFVLSVCLSAVSFFLSFFSFLPFVGLPVPSFVCSGVRACVRACVRAFCLSVCLSVCLFLPSFLLTVRSFFIPLYLLVSCFFHSSVHSVVTFALSSMCLFGLSFFYPLTFSVLVSSSQSSHDGLCGQCRVR